MKFEYQTIFVPMTYKEETTSGLFKSEGSFVPETQAFMERPEYLELLDLMGEEGWELVSVQSALKGSCKVSNIIDLSYGVVLPQTAGYFLFWKRAKE